MLWDDPEYAFNNPFFKDFSFATVFSTDTFYMGNYHPLTILWLYWESLLFSGGDPAVYNGFQPFWFHLNNLLFHVANTALVFYIIKEFLGDKKWQIAAITAVLFGIHPMHVESVAWVSEIKDVLYGFFYLAALLAYVRYQNTGDKKMIGAALVFFALSLLAKAQGVTLPVLFVLMDLYKKRGFSLPYFSSSDDDNNTSNGNFNISVFIEKIPFFALSIFFGLLAIKAQEAESAINPNFEGTDTIFYGSYGILHYLLQLFVPIGLSGAHPYPSNPVFEPLPGYFKLLPIGVIALGLVTWFFGKKNKDIWFGVLFYLITISIVLKLVPVGDTIVAERYTYIPYIGLFFIIGSLIHKFSENEKLKQPLQYGILGVVAILSIMTWQRTKVWENTFTFWSDVSEKYPNYWRGYNCIGQEYSQMAKLAASEGNNELAQQHYQSALANLAAACENDKWAPPIPYMLRGAIYVDNLKDYDNAIKDFKKVISFPNPNDPTQIEARYNLGLAYIRKKEFQNAVQILNEAITRSPNNPRGHYFMGLALAGAKNYKQAEQAYGKALTINPSYVPALLNRGVLYTDQINIPAKGIADFNGVLLQQPNHRDALINIGICLYKLNKNNEAIQQYNRCIQLMPNNGRILYLRALVYAQATNFKNAFTDAQKATQLGVQVSPQQMNEWKTKAGL
ncbi:MAG: tetratricopeptide repeat protein [Flavobacteriales bacterium]|nr:tetratricopeptide repeat protein [Flavobacteriales bacterium]